MKRLLCAVALLGWVDISQATVTDLGIIQPDALYATTVSGLVGAINDTVTFRLLTSGIVSYAWTDANISNFNIGGGNTSLNLVGGGSFDTFAGRALLGITGIGGATVFSGASREFQPGNYTLEFSYHEATVLPEADTWLMMLAGAGFIAWRMRRSAA